MELVAFCHHHSAFVKHRSLSTIPKMKHWIRFVHVYCGLYRTENTDSSTILNIHILM